MDKKKIFVLSIILGVLALGILIKSWVRSAQDAGLSIHGDGVVLTAFDPLKVERILIGRPVTQTTQSPAATSVELVKENGTWKVKSLWDAKADPARVESFLQKFHAIRGELRGSGEKFFPDFGIQGKEAFSVKFFDLKGALLSEVLIGTKQAGENGFFIRRPPSEEVYLADLNMADILGPYDDLALAAPAGGVWADLALFRLDPEKVTRITIYEMKSDQKTMMTGLEKVTGSGDSPKSSWKFLRKEITLPLDPEKILKFIGAMNSLRAEKVTDPLGKDYGLEKPAWQLAVTEGTKKTILNAGAKDEKENLCYVSRAGDPTVLALRSAFFEDLSVDDTHFVKDAAVDSESKKAT